MQPKILKSQLAALLEWFTALTFREAMKKITRLVALLALSINCIAPGLCLNPEAKQLHQQALAKASAGALDEALAIERRATSLDPDAGEPHGGLSFIYSKMGNNRQALIEAQTAVKLAPANAWVHRNLGYVLQNMGMCGAAIIEYQKSQSLAPAVENEINIAQCQLLMGNRAQSVKQLEALSKAHPGDYQVLINLAKVYLASGDTSGAEEKALEALKLHPNSYEPTYILTQIKAAGYRFHEAEEYAEKLVRIDPKNPEAYVLLASIYSGPDEQPVKATALLEQAKRQVPKNGDMFFSMSQYFLAQADRADPKNHTGSLQRQRTWRDLGKGALQAAVEANPKAVGYRIALADVLERSRDMQGAHDQVQAAHELSPGDVRVKALYNQMQAAKNDIAGCFKRWCYRTR
jgi:tetratricopeptide (TPR) repeat protein